MVLPTVAFFRRGRGNRFFVWRIVKSSATPQNDIIQMVSGSLKSFVVVCLTFQQHVECPHDSLYLNRTLSENTPLTSRWYFHQMVSGSLKSFVVVCLTFQQHVECPHDSLYLNRTLSENTPLTSRWYFHFDLVSMVGEVWENKTVRYSEQL